MAELLYMAAFLAVAVGVIHSVLGERYILIRLFRRADLPKLFGGVAFTIRTLRLAWHVTTIAWWGFAAILVMLAQRSVSSGSLSFILALTFLATGATTALVSRGRHLAWIGFSFIGGVCLYAALRPA
jgi:hypothetical protein